MKYKVGDIVFSTIWNKSVLIKDIRPNRFYLIADLEYLSRTMITYESNLKSREDDIEKDMEVYSKLCDEIMAIQGIEPVEVEMEQIIHCPEGYVFKDENGNVINATKIVLEKKKKEYPKTYEECCKVLEIEGNSLLINTKNITYYERDLGNLMGQLHRLIVCRDAYWRIAGKEMGLGKPWEPDWTNYNDYKFVIGVFENKIIKCYNTLAQYVLAFPTAEMRDAFYEAFREEIEICKELL